MDLNREIAARMARDLGADDAVVLTTADILLDPRVRFKCMVPKCYMSGACSHCPPHGYSLEQVQDAVDVHQWAVFFRVKVPASLAAAKGLADHINARVMDSQGSLFNLGAHYLLVFSIVKCLQQRLTAMGYTSRARFAAGNCKDSLCHFRPLCQELTTRQGCRHPDLSSPSMESCGMDVFTMAARAGWDIYPVGGQCEPQSVPQASLMGLVLVASDSLTIPAIPQGSAFSKPMGSGGGVHGLRSARRSLAAVRQGQAGASQLPGVFANRRVWSQFSKKYSDNRTPH